MENHYLYFLQYLRLLPDPNFSFIQDLVTNENYHHPDCDAERLIVNVFFCDSEVYSYYKYQGIHRNRYFQTKWKEFKAIYQNDLNDFHF